MCVKEITFVFPSSDCIPNATNTCILLNSSIHFYKLLHSASGSITLIVKFLSYFVVRAVPPYLNAHWPVHIASLTQEPTLMKYSPGIVLLSIELKDILVSVSTEAEPSNVSSLHSRLPLLMYPYQWSLLIEIVPLWELRARFSAKTLCSKTE